MTWTPSRPLLAALLIVVGLGMGAPVAASEPAFFSERVAPVLRKRCIECHNATRSRGGLSLASRPDLLRGGDQGAVIVPGKSGASRLVKLVSGDKPAMPRKGGPLTPEQIADIRKWIDDGAAWPENVTLSNKEGRPVVDASWWSLRPLERPVVPVVKTRGWVRNPVDAFVLATLETTGLRPAPEADRATLIRRLTFDLHGLPPSPEEIDAFVADSGPRAYERLVERLLASPRHGERWGRHWLDIVHYADTHGYDKDKRRDHAWPYRDYVIRAFNSDKPYPRFIREQLAGDFLYPEADGTVASGFVTAGPWDFVGHVELREGTVDKMKTRLLDRDDMVSSTMSTFVSMTVHCARCHDHKFDPIPQQDYYALQAVFAGVERGNRPYDPPEPAARRAGLARRQKELEAHRAELAMALDRLSSPELVQLDAALQRLRRDLAALPSPTGKRPSPTNGYHSTIVPRPDARKWVQVDLGASLSIEVVRLIPARPTDFPDTPGFGFPARFRVDVSDDPTFAKCEAIADHTAADFPNPGDKAFVVRLAGKKARFVRVTAEKLWPRTNDYVFALAELQVESSGKNVALGKPVIALDSIEAGRWSRRHLVDNFDSRRELPDATNPATAAVLQKRSRLEAEIRQAETKRHELRQQLLDPSTRAAMARNATELADVVRQSNALPPPGQVYAVLSI